VFDTAGIGQSTPLADASNLLSVTLHTSCDFPENT